MTSTSTPKKRASTSKASPTPKKALERSPPSSKPFFRIYHSEILRQRTLLLLGTLEQASDATEHSKELSELIVELTRDGLDYCFMRPLKLAKPGFVIEQTAKLGMVGVQQVMGSVVHKIIGRMDSRQLISVSGSIRQLML